MLHWDKKHRIFRFVSRDNRVAKVLRKKFYEGVSLVYQEQKDKTQKLISSFELGRFLAFPDDAIGIAYRRAILLDKHAMDMGHHVEIREA